ncbi:hypothetical protein M2171_004930 [Bradyrhizobium japonicum USDA 38]|uniref:hypothetical protein n=1 Tax=Bradyrhizobium japonicum TaxID=375 RepID=UPI00048A0E5F|nr:hypothetical protein [Bradyrhizobium japonicum]MCS3895797.1 hypothetical protein [Bradyrhizobium japonicum USDA 38]MCS3948312.1 hypothetical protein [Bradyrhizobium japonicum]
MRPPRNAAAFDLGLTEEAREHFRERLALLFREGCAIFGAAKASKLFREQARAAPKEIHRAKTKPPQKRKGPHDPESDKYLVQLWMTGHWGSKHDFARKALKHQSVKIRNKIVGKVIGKNRDQDEREVKSIIRRLDRALQRRAALRQIGRQKAKT